MNKSDFNFNLPESLIAQTPILNRSESRMLALNKKTGDICHKSFGQVTDYLQQGDCLVINDTKVIPARLIGVRKSTGAKVELLLLTRKDENTWEALVKPGRKARAGDELVFGDGVLSAKIMALLEDGKREVKFTFDGIFEEILDSLGEMPLPPYITEKLKDKNRYQTVYAKQPGSVAAPTAGLHFTDELLEVIERKGISIARVTLHVGLGTFRPVKAENIFEHEMHSELYAISEGQAYIMNEAKKNGGSLVAVGTTSCRTLESCSNDQGFIQHGSGWTDIFIFPGYKFKTVDKLITNFHLPESTLIMLVSALAGRENVLNAYYKAVEKEYRFFSFGDAMIVY